MSRPESLPIPPLSAYQFINFRLWSSSPGSIGGNNNIIISHACDWSSWDYDDDSYRFKFNSPELIPVEFVASIDLMSDRTFEGLIGGSSYYIENIHIGTKLDLTAVAMDRPIINGEEIDYSRASNQQIEAFLICVAAYESLYHWGRVAELYNTSSDEQKEVIYNFFKHCQNRDIADLYAMPGPNPLPEDLQSQLEEKYVDGMRMVFSEVHNDWRCDHIASHNFTVNGYRGNSKNKEYIIACATTLEEAVAYATRYALEIDAKDTKERIAIEHLGKEICSGKILSHTARTGFDHVLPVRLSWDIEKTEPFPRERIHKALLEVEKKMGVKWTKVRMLEDELGL